MLDFLFSAAFFANYDQELSEEREKAEDLYFTFNHTAPKEKALREDILKKLLPKMGERVTILSPFYTDYGYNCNIGSDCFINHNAYLMDCAPITLGSHCFIGPNCGMYTAIHATIAEERNLGLEKALPITVGDNVWMGGDVTILPGVTIGGNTIIGAGSVVIEEVPPNCTVVGVPGRIVKRDNVKMPRSDMDQCHLPDPVKEDITVLQRENAELVNRVLDLEQAVRILSADAQKTK